MDILILEDHPIVLDAIKSRIEQELVGAHISYAGASLEDALRSVDLTKPACAVVDLDLGDGRTPVEIVSTLAKKVSIQNSVIDNPKILFYSYSLVRC